MRDDEANGVAVICAQGLAVVMCGEQDFLAVEVGQGDVGREPLFGVDQDVGCFRLGMNSRQQLAEGYAVPVIVEAAPSRYTVKIAGARGAR